LMVCSQMLPTRLSQWAEEGEGMVRRCPAAAATLSCNAACASY
jgi:hypothetical protein